MYTRLKETLQGNRQGDEPAPPKPPKQTWKEYAGRTSGPDGYVLGDLTRRKAGQVKTSVIDSVKGRVLRVIGQAYVEKIKPQLTESDKHMPMSVRRAVHEVADEFWAELSLELPSLIDRVLAAAEQERAERNKADDATPMLGGLLEPPPPMPSPPTSPPGPDDDDTGDATVTLGVALDCGIDDFDEVAFVRGLASPSTGA